MSTVTSEQDYQHFRSVNDRLRIRWSRLLRHLTEKSEDFWLDLAIRAIQKSEYNDALVNLYQALEISPDHAQALLFKGQVLQTKAFATKNLQQHTVQLNAMVAAYERAMKSDPSLRREIEKRLMFAYFNEFKKGAVTFKKAHEVTSLFDAAAVFFENAARVREAIQADIPAPDTPWGAYANQSLSLLNAGRWEEAIAPLEMTLARGQRSEDTYLFLASLYRLQNEIDKEIAVLEQAYELFSKSEQVEAQLLNAYVRDHRADRAVGVYERAIRREPDNVLFAYNYATLLLELERFDEAIQRLEALVKRDAYNTDVQLNLGVAYFNKACSLEEASPSGDHAIQLELMYGKSIAPLEKARLLLQSEDAETTAIARALYIAYQKTKQEDKMAALATSVDYDLDPTSTV